MQGLKDRGNLIPYYSEQTHSCHPEFSSGSCSRIADQARNDRNIKGFTLIELLVVVLIIAILGAMALPKYMVARDRAHLSGLMTVAKNVKDSMNRYRLSSGTEGGSTTNVLHLLDISFKKSDGTDCTSSYCNILVSGKEYRLQPIINNSGFGDTVLFLSIDNSSFGYLYTQIEGRSYENYMNCNNYGSNQSVDSGRCQKMAKSLGASCGAIYCNW